MTFDRTLLLLLLLIAGFLLFTDMCSDKELLTKKEGEELAKKSELALEKLDSIFKYVEKLDSSEIINNYYTNNYAIEKKSKDSLLALYPELADSLFLYHVRKLRSESSPINP